MKRIYSEEMSKIQGGSFWDGFCVGAGLCCAFFPVSAPVSGIILVGCSIVGISEWPKDS